MIALYVLAGAGLVFYLWDSLARLARLLRANYKSYFSGAVRGLSNRLAKRQSLKKKVGVLNNGKKDNFLLQSYHTMSEILAATGEKAKEKQMRGISLVCAGIGVLIALYLQSYMLLPILAVGLWLIPMWLIKFKLFRYQLKMQNELSVVLSMVTNSYIRNENLVESVAENLTYMNEPCKSIFQSFVYASRQVNPNAQKNITVLKHRIDNKIFHLWCDSMILCQSDINQKASLNAVVEQFATEKDLYNILSAEISNSLWVFLLIAGLSTLCFPLAALLGYQLEMQTSFSELFTTLSGQAIVVGYVISLLFGFNKAITLSTSME